MLFFQTGNFFPGWFCSLGMLGVFHFLGRHGFAHSKNVALADGRASYE